MEALRGSSRARVGRSGGEAVRPHDIYACYNCPDWPTCKYRRRAKYMSNLDQWTKCPRR